MIKKIAVNSVALKSWQSLAAPKDLLQRTVEAVKKGEREASRSGVVQSLELVSNGLRQLLSIGRLFIIPASVCDSPKDFPIAMLYGTVVRELNLGEETADLISNKIGDSPEWDSYSQVDFKELKKRLFTGEDGKLTSLIVFSPSWSNSRDFVAFKFTDDDLKLENLIRHQTLSCYYDPRLSSAFDAMATTVDTTTWSVENITPKLQYPFLSENPFKQYPELEKVASTKKKVFLTRKNADELTQQQLDPQELNVFESLDQALTTALMPEVESLQEAAGEFKSPGQVTTAPEGDRNNPDYGEEGSYTEEVNKENEKTAGERHDDVPVAPVPNVFQGGDNTKAVDSKTARPNGYMNKNTPEGTVNNPCAKCRRPILEGELTNGSASAEAHINCPTFGPTVPEPKNNYYASKAKKAKIAGLRLTTASIKLTFGTNNVYFDMNGSKYMLDGFAAEQFLDEWLAYRATVKSAEQKVVENLTQKYMDKMKKRPDATKKAPVQERRGPVSAPVTEQADSVVASKEAGFFDKSIADRVKEYFTGPRDVEALTALMAIVEPAVNGGQIPPEEIPLGDAMARKTGLTKEWEAAKKDNAAAVYLWRSINKILQDIRDNKQASDATYIASLFDDEDDDTEAISTKGKEARVKYEAKLNKEFAGRKKADVPLTEESIWDSLTEEFGEAPQVELKNESSGTPFSEDTRAPQFEGKAESAPKADTESEKPYPEPKRDEPEEKKESPKAENKAPNFEKKEEPKPEEKKDIPETKTPETKEDKPVEKPEEKSKEASWEDGQWLPECPRPERDRCNELDPEICCGGGAGATCDCLDCHPPTSGHGENPMETPAVGYHGASVEDDSKQAAAGDDMDEEVPIGGIDVLASLVEGLE